MFDKCFSDLTFDHREVTELTEESDTLKTENLELQAQLQQLQEQQQKQEKEKPPMSR